MNYYSHHIGDFDRATRHLTRIERGVYRDLLDAYYDTEAPLTLDRAALCRKIIARSNEEVTAVEQVLSEFFDETPAGWYHARCEEEIEAYRASNSQKSAAGKASAAKRALKLQRALNGDPTPAATVVEPAFNGSATNQEPITNNHKPIKTKDKSPAALDRLFPNVDPQIVADFKALRAKHRAPVTQTAVDGIVREAAIAGVSLDGALRICCERGWRAFKAEWITRDVGTAGSARSPNAGQKFNFANADRSGDLAAQAATERRLGLVMPDGEVEL